MVHARAHAKVAVGGRWKKASESKTKATKYDAGSSSEDFSPSENDYDSDEDVVDDEEAPKVEIEGCPPAGDHDAFADPALPVPAAVAIPEAPLPLPPPLPQASTDFWRQHRGTKETQDKPLFQNYKNNHTVSTE